MRMNPTPRHYRLGAWLCALVVVPAVSTNPATTAEMTHQLASVWIPATAYGLTLITALSKAQR